ncbi:MAG: tRNA lysidine(34) synthetase TilS [Desulfobaccales bacterium]
MAPRIFMIQPCFEPVDPHLLPEFVHRYIREQDLFRPQAHLLVAVSGGPDSVALLHLLHRLGPEWGLHLGVAHFEHGLRGEASREDARFVAGLAQTLGLPFHGGQGDVRQAAHTQKVSLQMAARRLRLDFLRQVWLEQHYDRLALGHTADDQVELFFLRLFRGAGTEGLKGMWPCTPEGLVRPLLAVGKEMVLAWLRQEQLPYREDQSNLNRRYRRNRIRLDLLPDLEQNYNPRLKTAVWHLMCLLQEDERLLAAAVDQAWSAVGRWLTPDCAALSVPVLLTLAPAMQKRLLRRTLGRFLGHQEITSAQVNNLLALAQGKKSGGLIDFGSCRVARAGPELHVFSPLPSGPTAVLLPGPGAVESPAGWRLEAREVDGPPDEPCPPNLSRVALDKVAFPLVLRALQPGDRFRPAGAPGTKKIQDFLVDAKIPHWLRPHLPLVLSRDTIIWIPGLRLAESVKPKPRSTGLLKLTLSPLNPAAARIWDLLLAFTKK